MCKFQALYIEDFDNLRNKLEELNLTAFLRKAAKETTAPLIQATSTLIFFAICLGLGSILEQA